MLFYRIEHKTEPSPDVPNVNLGPYRDCLLAELLTDGEYDEDVHPTPNFDPLLRKLWDTLGYIRADFVFGFASLTSLHAWFYSEEGKQEADKEGLGRIGVYQVADEYFHKGQFQAIALASELTLIETKPCVFRE